MGKPKRFGSRRQSKSQGQGKKPGTKSTSENANPELGVRGEEAAGILEFSFGYDFKEHIDVVDLSKCKFPPKKNGNGTYTGYGPGEQQEPQPHCSTSARAGPGYPDIKTEGITKDGPLGLELYDKAIALCNAGDEKTERDLNTGAEVDLKCQKCNNPTLIWVKNYLSYEGKVYGVLVQLCRDFRCACITGNLKRTSAPDFLVRPERFLPAVLDCEALIKTMEEQETKDRAMGRHIPFPLAGKTESGELSYDIDPITGKSWRDLAKDPMEDPDLKQLVEDALADPTLGIPQCFDKPFDLEGSRQLKNLSDSELLHTLKDMFPDGIPDLTKVLQISSSKTSCEKTHVK